MMYERGKQSGRTLAVLPVIVIAAVALANMPETFVVRLRDSQRQCTLPVQRQLATWLPAARPAATTADELKALDERRNELKLAVDVQLHRLQAAGASDPGNTTSLLIPAAVDAHVIGRQGRDFFTRLLQLDAGLADGVLPSTWVVDPALPLVDGGRDLGVKAGHLLLAGSRVWGQVRDAGAHTSTILPVTAHGYRDLVQLAGPGPSGMRLGARGILEGTGECLCRVRMVKTTEPVEAGDLVLTAGGDELLPTPLVYGRIVRAERASGSLHWELWMQPAAIGMPERVTILRVSLNAARLAERDRSAQPADGSLAEEAAR